MLAPAVSIHTQRWYRQLTDSGIDVNLITASPAEGTDIPQVTIAGNHTGAWRYLLTVGHVMRVVEDINPDIVHCHYATSYGLWGANIRFHPLIISAWGSDITVTPKNSITARLITRRNLKAADRICATSEYLSSKIVDLVPAVAGNIDIVPFGIDTDIFVPSVDRGFDPDHITVGTARALETTYGLDILIKAFASIRLRYGNAKLKIVGDGPELQSLESLVSDLELGESVEFRGRLKSSEMPEFIGSLDIFAMPSREESFGVAALEAMSCGVPVVASNVGGLPEILDNGNCGRLVEPNNPDAFSDAILSLLGDRNTMKKLSEAGRTRVLENFSASICTDKQISVYKSLLH